MFRPWEVKTRRLKEIADYAATTLVRESSPEQAPVFIDNRGLDGFLASLRERRCSPASCVDCDFCAQIAHRHVRIDLQFRADALAQGQALSDGMYDGTHWR
jgi:hypothetical protein